MDGRIWSGQIELDAVGDPSFDNRPGIMGGGLLCGNLSEQAVAECTRLGEQFEEMYRSAIFPNGQSGALKFAGRRVE